MENVSIKGMQFVVKGEPQSCTLIIDIDFNSDSFVVRSVYCHSFKTEILKYPLCAMFLQRNIDTVYFWLNQIDQV